MSAAVPQFSRSLVDKAGRQLVADDSVTEETDAAWEILANWRSAHAFPLNTITMDLRQKVNKIDSSAIVVQRLKRSRSILAKLSAKPSMRLTQMQDIGGCRAVLKTISDVYSLREKYKNSKSLHELVTEDDYIVHSKSSGYRGIHLVYKFQSKSKEKYNKLLFEVQLRTITQHAWATAVETVGAVIGQALKSSEGELAWLHFFQKAAVALEHMEDPEKAAVRSPEKRILARSIFDLSRSLDVTKKLTAYRSALKATENEFKKGAGYFLLVLLPDQLGLQIHSFEKRDAERAHKEYARLERQLPLRTKQLPLFPELSDYTGAQVVLVGAESFRSIHEAFPNYYLDTKIFQNSLEDFVIRHR
ncbi:RelA/SpoT domain-containing protein [Nevskia ramosa]|uniref:RelA/SpoT domain-containing protein n=1 Tax=Nevskia ramosa TaxID=64002 RepID=UPI000A0191B7|nr:RelA/SpoT domain-containing protein [Nevskia ramosa]